MAQFLEEDIRAQLVSLVGDSGADRLMEALDAKMETYGYLDEAMAIAQGRSPSHDYEVPKPGKVGPKAKRKRKYGKSWHRGYVDMAWRGQRSEFLEPTEAYLKGVWAVHKGPAGWVISHGPSGMSAWTGFSSKADAQKALDAILDEFPFMILIGQHAEPGRGHDIGAKINRHMDRIKQIISDVKSTN